MLVAYYLPEPHSDAVQQLVRRTATLAISDLVEVEFASAMVRRVRTRELPREDAQRVFALFSAHTEGGVYTRLPLERRMYGTATAWLANMELPLNTLDALHLAVAASHGIPIATADNRLARCAAALGVSARRIGR